MVVSESNKDIFLFYGVYDTNQLLKNDLGFIPCIFDNKYPWKYEFQIYKAIYNLVLKSQDNTESFIGLLSSSFAARTGLDYQSVCNLIKENNADIYVFSPYQYNSLIYYNYWDQAEICHKGIRNEVKKIFALNKKYPTLDFQSRTPKINFSYCNFWVAKRDFFIKIVKDMIYLDELMTKNKLGLKDTYHRSQFVYKFNSSLKKNYKLYPFIMERYLSANLMDKRQNKTKPKVFYWNDKREPLEQVEKMENSIERCKGPVARAQYHRSKNTIFKNKRDFYEKVWLNEDFEGLDKGNPMKAKRINDLCSFI